MLPPNTEEHHPFEALQNTSDALPNFQQLPMFPVQVHSSGTVSSPITPAHCSEEH